MNHDEYQKLKTR